jgi:cytochrome b subunit of formate dehydrogenase
MEQVAQYFLYAVFINASALLIVVGMVIWAFVQIKKDTSEIIRHAENLGAMTQNVAAMTREVLRRTE